MTAPTGALSPSFTRTSERTPSSKASSSMFALSVSTSASTSPIATLSPGCFSQRRIFPSSIVSESFGMVTSGIDASGRDGSRSYGVLARAPGRRRTNRRLLEPEEPAHGSDDAIRRRDHEGLQVGRVWHRHVDARQTVGRRVELVERLAHDERDHLRGHTGKRPAFLDDEAATRASHGVDDRLAVERPNGAEVEHFHLDAVAGELLGGLEGGVQHLGPRDDGHVAPGPLHVGQPERYDVLAGRHLALERVHHLPLAEAREHALGDLVRALVVPDLLAHEEDRGVALHLLHHGFAEGLAEGHDARLRHTRARSPSPAPGAATARRTRRRPRPAP